MFGWAAQLPIKISCANIGSQLCLLFEYSVQIQRSRKKPAYRTTIQSSEKCSCKCLFWSLKPMFSYSCKNAVLVVYAGFSISLDSHCIKFTSLHPFWQTTQSPSHPLPQYLHIKPPTPPRTTIPSNSMHTQCKIIATEFQNKHTTIKMCHMIHPLTSCVFCTKVDKNSIIITRKFFEFFDNKNFVDEISGEENNLVKRFASCWKIWSRKANCWLMANVALWIFEYYVHMVYIHMHGIVTCSQLYSPILPPFPPVFFFTIELAIFIYKHNHPSIPHLHTQTTNSWNESWNLKNTSSIYTIKHIIDLSHKYNPISQNKIDKNFRSWQELYRNNKNSISKNNHEIRSKRLFNSCLHHL